MVDGHRMLVITNSPRIYSVAMPEIARSDTEPRHLPCRPVCRTQDRTAPDGHEPFMISTYCRHGIRHIDSARCYRS